MVYDKNNVFAKILLKEIPCKLVYEDQYVMSFHDINPEAPVHVLVIPKQEVASFEDLVECGNEALGNFFKSVDAVVKTLSLSKDGFRAVFNHGKNGLQTVPHFHLHLLGGEELSSVLNRR